MDEDDSDFISSDYRFAPIPEELLYDGEMTPLAVRVYGCLMRHGLTPSTCYPSQARIAGLVGVEKRSVQRPLRQLEDRGWITRTARYNGRGDRLSDRFEIHTIRRPPALESAPPTLDSAEGPRDGAREDRASERGEDRASARGHGEREPENESQGNESNLPGGKQASTDARGGDVGPASRAKLAALRAAQDIVDMRVASGKPITDPAGLAVHIALEDIWPEHGRRLTAEAEAHPDRTVGELADLVQARGASTGGAAAGGSTQGDTAALYREAEARRQQFLAEPGEPPDPDLVRDIIAAARDRKRPSEEN